MPINTEVFVYTQEMFHMKQKPKGMRFPTLPIGMEA